MAEQRWQKRGLFTGDFVFGSSEISELPFDSNLWERGLPPTWLHFSSRVDASYLVTRPDKDSSVAALRELAKLYQRLQSPLVKKAVRSWMVDLGFYLDASDLPEIGSDGDAIFRALIDGGAAQDFFVEFLTLPSHPRTAFEEFKGELSKIGEQAQMIGMSAVVHPRADFADLQNALCEVFSRFSEYAGLVCLIAELASLGYDFDLSLRDIEPERFRELAVREAAFYLRFKKEKFEEKDIKAWVDCATALRVEAQGYPFIFRFVADGGFEHDLSSRIAVEMLNALKRRGPDSLALGISFANDVIRRRTSGLAYAPTWGRLELPEGVFKTLRSVMEDSTQMGIMNG